MQPSETFNISSGPGVNPVGMGPIRLASETEISHLQNVIKLLHDMESKLNFHNKANHLCHRG